MSAVTVIEDADDLATRDWDRVDLSKLRRVDPPVPPGATSDFRFAELIDGVPRSLDLIGLNDRADPAARLAGAGRPAFAGVALTVPEGNDLGFDTGHLEASVETVAIGFLHAPSSQTTIIIGTLRVDPFAGGWGIVRTAGNDYQLIVRKNGGAAVNPIILSGAGLTAGTPVSIAVALDGAAVRYKVNGAAPVDLTATNRILSGRTHAIGDVGYEASAGHSFPLLSWSRWPTARTAAAMATDRAWNIAWFAPLGTTL